MALVRLKKIVDEGDHGITLLDFMKSQFGLNSKVSCALVQSGKVSVMGSFAATGLMSRPLFKLSSGDVVACELEKHTQVSKIVPKLKILYKDHHLLALRKVSGVVVHGGSKISQSIESCIHEYQFEKDEPPRLVHRLDKDTSGVLLLARTKEMAQIFAKYFSEPEKYIKKIYVGMLLPDSNDETVLEKDCGVVNRIETGIFNMNLHGKEKQRLTLYDSKDPFTNTGEKVEKAITDYVYVGSSKKMGTIALFSPVTGRKHQIRVHAAQSLGRAIVGDYKYGPGTREKIKKSLPARFPMMLHLKSIILKDYFGKELTINAPYTTEFQKCVNATGMEKFVNIDWPKNE